MSNHSEAFKAWLTVEQYCNNTDCDNCCFYLGKDHDNEEYCPFDTYFLCLKYIAEDLHEEKTKKGITLQPTEKNIIQLAMRYWRLPDKGKHE